MPIRPENRARYGKDWPEFARSIKERARWRCECMGECGLGHKTRCGARHDALGRRDKGIWFKVYPHEIDTPALADIKVTKVVLTVAHLDHTPETRDPTKLKAMCQGCHLHYDKGHHAETRYTTRRAGKAVRDLLE